MVVSFLNFLMRAFSSDRLMKCLRKQQLAAVQLPVYTEFVWHSLKNQFYKLCCKTIFRAFSCFEKQIYMFPSYILKVGLAGLNNPQMRDCLGKSNLYVSMRQPFSSDKNMMPAGIRPKSGKRVGTHICKIF